MVVTTGSGQFIGQRRGADHASEGGGAAEDCLAAVGGHGEGMTRHGVGREVRERDPTERTFEAAAC
ncbi:MAG: hypothetical protein ACYDAG_11885 [Chloroflexota bacterium]